MKNLLTPLLFLFSLLIVSNIQAQITGVAYRDYNGNGSRQTVAPNQEPGVPGVIVSAYNASDALVNTTTTAADGTYTLAYSVPVRLEFTLPAGSGCVSSAIDHSSFGGEGNSIRFVSASGAQNYAINNPADYVGSTNPSVYVNQYANGNPLVAGTSQNATWFVGFPYNNTGTTAPTQTLAGAAATIGTTWAINYILI